MNDMFEFWTPWQALQRSLANGFGAEAPGSAAPGSMSLSSAATVSTGGSWLARARLQLPPAQMYPPSRVPG